MLDEWLLGWLKTLLLIAPLELLEDVPNGLGNELMFAGCELTVATVSMPDGMAECLPDMCCEICDR